jgi:hypothetical protein
MNNPEPKHGSEQGIVEQKVRRAVAINALRKISAIVAMEQQTDTGKAKALHWFVRYGWIILPGAALLLAYALGVV